MCGRLACGLEPEQICNSCCYKQPGNNNYVRPQWRGFSNGGKTYKPSYNICPTEVVPVLLSGNHFDSDSRIVAPMVFGLIPPWTKAGETSKYSTINCRLETMKTSKLYGSAFKKGHRCVVVCNGFYEWQRENSAKKPYFIHFEQPKGVVVDDPNTWNVEFTSERGFNGFRLLRMAALFERQTSHEGEESTFSFTIITREASSKMSWLHSRMPLIVETEEQLDTWLNNEQFDGDEALKVFFQIENVVCFPVSSSVNKTINKDLGCIKQNFESEKTSKSTKESSMLRNWLQRGKKREADDTKDVPEKIKKEND